MRPAFTWRLRSRSLELGTRTLIMGVVNVTPDSFSDGGLYVDRDHAVDHTLRLLDEGADLLDIGGESTRPGASVVASSASSPDASSPGVTANEELKRILPVIEGVLRARPDAIISVDTYKAEVARHAVLAGVEIVNDVSAGSWDTLMLPTLADLQSGAVLMHTRGRPQQWRALSPVADMVALVRRELEQRTTAALAAGMARDHIVLDPGFGFGKNFDENYPLLAQMCNLAELGFPLLAGTSRKGFIGRTLARESGDLLPKERLYGSLAAMTVSILNGAHIVRVHDVAPSVHAARVTDAILKANASASL